MTAIQITELNEFQVLLADFSDFLERMKSFFNKNDFTKQLITSMLSDFVQKGVTELPTVTTAPSAVPTVRETVNDFLYNYKHGTVQISTFNDYVRILETLMQLNVDVDGDDEQPFGNIALDKVRTC